MKAIIIIGFFLCSIVFSIAFSNTVSLLIKGKTYETEDKTTLTFKEAKETMSNSSIFRDNPNDEYKRVYYKSVTITPGIFSYSIHVDTLKSSFERINERRN